MQHDQPLLTIAIPTYNRAKYLKQLLDSLAPQLDRHDNIELIISDNASTDETSEEIRRYIQGGMKARYLRNDINIGPDRNFIQCFEIALGKYVWMIGDDDILLDGALAQILRFLETGDYDLVYLTPFGFRDCELRKQIPSVTHCHALVIEDAGAFVRRIGTMFTLITCNIVNKRSVQAVEHQPFSNFVGSNFAQLSWVYPALANFRKGLYFQNRCVAIRDGTSGGYSVARVFGSSLKSITENLLPDHADLRNTIYHSALRGILPLAILQVRRRVHGDFLEEDFDSTLRPIYGNSWDYWLWVYPIARAPLPLAVIWYRCIRLAVLLRSRLRRHLSFKKCDQ